MVGLGVSKRLAVVVGSVLGAVTMVMSSSAVGAEVPVPVPGAEVVPIPDAPDPVPEADGDAEAVVALSGIVEIDGGFAHTCARLSNGTAKCWGSNEFGQLGVGDRTTRLSPVTVRNPSGSGPLTGIVEIDTGWVHTCARLIDGTARCWGANAHGQLGDGTTVNRLLPVTVKNPAGTGPLTGIAQLTAGDGDTTAVPRTSEDILVIIDWSHTCARLIDGTARCWGWNRYGGLGIGTTTDRLLPTTVKNPSGTGPLTGVADIAAGYGYSCAVLADSTARCWGYNGSGGLGDGTTTDRRRPTTVKNTAGTGPLTGVVRVEAGYTGTCASLADQTGRCWGYNGSGQLGDGTTTDRLLPVVIKAPSGSGALSGVAGAIRAGGYHSCTALADRTTRCWGYNGSGQLGDGTTTDRLLPITVKNPAGTGPLTTVTQMVAGHRHSCAVLADTTARCWGSNFYGQLGNGSTVNRKLPVTVKRGA